MCGFTTAPLVHDGSLAALDLAGHNLTLFCLSSFPPLALPVGVVTTDIFLCLPDSCRLLIFLMFSSRNVFLPPPVCLPRMSAMYLFMNPGMPWITLCPLYRVVRAHAQGSIKA